MDENNNNLMDSIISGLKNEFNNNPAPEKCTVKKTYEDNRVDIILDNDTPLSYINCLGEPQKNSKGVLIYLNGNYDNPLVIIETDTTEPVILALGLGKFTISSDGDLYVELPNNVENPFSINNNGDLLIELPDDATNDYEIDENGDLIFDRWDI